jgi:hypothetical protein
MIDFSAKVIRWKTVVAEEWEKGGSVKMLGASPELGPMAIN